MPWDEIAGVVLLELVGFDKDPSAVLAAASVLLPDVDGDGSDAV